MTRLLVGSSVLGLVAGSMVGIAALPASASATAGPAEVKLEQRAAKTKVTGKIAGGRGMTLIAIESSGRIVKKKLPASGKFSVTLGKGAALHLVGKQGNYFGPVVLRGNAKNGKLAKSKLVYQRLAKSGGSLKLKTIKLKSGYAAPTKPAAKKSVITARKSAAVAVKGKPVGAGKHGYVRVASNQMLNVQNLPAVDLDRDGLPSAFDIDDNGNLILDNVDRTNRVGTLRAGSLATDGVRLFSNYKSTSSDFSDIINANVAIPSESQLDASVAAKTRLAIAVTDGALLSCTGMLYCPAEPMPLVAGPTGDFQWQLSDTYPSLKAADVNAGDTFIETLDGVNYTGILNFMFKTTPALKSYTVVDSSGGVVSTQTVDWSAPNKAGSQGNPINVNATAGEKVRLTFWRPQRQAVSGEASLSGYVDLGGLQYQADSHPGFCPATAVGAGATTITDGGSTAVLDTTGDAIPTTDSTLTMEVDLSTCVGSGNQNIDIQARSLYGDNSAQKVFFTKS